MTTPYPPRRQLARSRTDRVLGGVCGGAASYLNMDATLVRILTAVLSLVFPVTIVAYVVLLFALPEQQPNPDPHRQVNPDGTDPIWGSGGAPWHQSGPVPTETHAEPNGDHTTAVDPTTYR